MTALILLALACGEKKAPEPAAAPTEAAPTSTNVPADKNSQEFASRLFKTDLKDFKPIDGVDGAGFVYTSMIFDPAGTWSAKGTVTVADESMDCVEGGAWTMEPAESEDAALLSWTLDKTNCAGREAGLSYRAKVTIDKNGAVKIEGR